MWFSFSFNDDSYNILVIFVWTVSIFLACEIMAWIGRRGRFILPNDSDSESDVSQVGKPKQAMIQIGVPFALRLEEASTSVEVQCLIASRVNYKMLVFWKVSICSLHLLLRETWSAIYNLIEEGTILQGSCLVKEDLISEGNHEEKAISFTRKCFDLGPPPRLYYPLVILMFAEDHFSYKPQDIVALITVVHLRDSFCTKPSKILFQLVIQANGQLSVLKELYLASSSDPDGNRSSEAEVQLCVVCQCLPLSRALLPCRHACVCGSCFRKLDTCPICRSQITAYFCIRNEDYLCNHGGSQSSHD